MEKVLFEVTTTWVPKSTINDLLKLHKERTGEDLDVKALDLYELYTWICDTAEEFSVPGAIGFHDTLIVRAWTRNQAQDFVAHLREKDDFSVYFNIEVRAAHIFDAE